MVRYVPQVSIAKIFDRIPISNRFISLKLDSVREAELLGQLLIINWDLVRRKSKDNEMEDGVQVRDVPEIAGRRPLTCCYWPAKQSENDNKTIK